VDSQAIATWAEKKAKPAESVSYTRLTDADRITILRLHDQGISQLEISKRLDRAVSTVHEVIQKYAPTIDMARRKLAAGAERMAENIIENGLARDHIQALNGLGVLNQQDTGKVSIVINGLHLHGTARPDAIEAESVSPVLDAGPGESTENT
jgi:hypothetical protein